MRTVLRGRVFSAYSVLRPVTARPWAPSWVPSPVVQVVLWSAGWVLMAAHKLARSRAAREYHRPFFNSPPPGWIGPVFTPRLDFPLAVDVNNSDAAPSSGGSGDLHDCKWEAIDFREEPERYLQTVLEYCFDGNVESDFVPQKNSKRSWYHAPWMSHGKKGREPFHGLTFEKPAKPGYLAEDQQSVAQTWAVAFYNERGATVFGKVWRNHHRPDLSSAVNFPRGSVSFKLIFSEATPSEVPFLKGSPVWKATVAKRLDLNKDPSRERVPRDLRLIQVDLAVRDQRAESTTGWVFGTFIYHCDVASRDPWRRLMPVSLMWGNDPWLTPGEYDKGARTRESWVSPKAIQTLPKSRGSFGWLGRGNGVVDNFKSSCISCHSTASYPKVDMLPPRGSDGRTTMEWFRNIKPGERFASSSSSMDYSLQLSVGLENYDQWHHRWIPSYKYLPFYHATTASLTKLNKVK